jgi:hypothetical protein
MTGGVSQEMSNAATTTPNFQLAKHKRAKSGQRAPRCLCWVKRARLAKLGQRPPEMPELFSPLNLSNPSRHLRLCVVPQATIAQQGTGRARTSRRKNI